LSDTETQDGNHHFIFRGINLESMTGRDIAQHNPAGFYTEEDAGQYLSPISLTVNEGVFNHPKNVAFPTVTVSQNTEQLLLTCTCSSERGKLCEHEATVLQAILQKEEFAVFFNTRLRHQKLKNAAIPYGLENEPDPDQFFRIELVYNKLVISPRSPDLFPVTKESLNTLRKMIPADPEQAPASSPADHEQTVFVVIREHKYYKYLHVELFASALTKEGKLKNPLNRLEPMDLVWKTTDHEELKFYTGISKFQNNLTGKKSETDLAALRAIVKNPLGYPFYYQDTEKGEKISASSLIPVKVAPLPDGVQMRVKPDGLFFELSLDLEIDGKRQTLKDQRIMFSYFLLNGDTLYLTDNLQALNIMSFLKQKPGNMLVHQSKYPLIKSQWLGKLEDTIDIKYQHIQTATSKQLEQMGFNQDPEKVIYLSDFGSHVMIIPVMRYGEAEIPIRTKRNIYAVDAKGNEFMVQRNEPAEAAFIANLTRQHPYFEEQADDDLYYFYLHKKHFLNEDWFPDVFEQWRNQQITILGFNEIEGNRLNPHKISIDIKVLSGINWFNTIIEAKYGPKKASLKALHKAIRNKSKFVQLDDGTLGILPAEWIAKFESYFNAGEVVSDDTIHTPKINFTAIEELYDAEVLAQEVKQDLRSYREQFANFETITPVDLPADLQGTLRPYQHQGLNWLNFLDDFNFGGCLADDMGLGKSIQVLAFILSQRKKVSHNTNLIVVPTSLIFNWQQEIQKFAPSIRLHTLYGADRVKEIHDFDQYEIILTSYGNMLSDVRFLKDYHFNYVILDESQNIKNPSSQRYKAVRLLKSRNKLVVTGTPIENNTFDLYGQLSFACPGLLGGKQYFKDIYSTPIDQFKSNIRAAELQKKIKPFILRRTKEQVAGDLPEKTEMVLHCEMGAEQKRIYDAYEKEFREYISAINNEELKKSPMNVLKGLTKLRQICDSPVLLSGDRLPGKESAKIDTLIEQIESKSPEHKILVFSQFTGMLELISKELLDRKISFVQLTGKTRNREAVVQSFQQDHSCRVFLISLKAGGTGLNLTEADYIYLVDPWWNPAVENQAIDRAHRIGQNKRVVAVRLICPGTVEEKIMQIQETKKDLVHDLVKTDTNILKALSRQDLLDLLTPLHVLSD
jgi:SNF2 family DNA or RNA helicase